MRIVGRVVFVRTLLSIFLVGLSSRALAQAPVAACMDDPATNTTTCRIDNPLVTQRMTEYDGAFHPELFEAFGHCSLFGCNQRFGVQLPGISLVPGDAISVNADGCVQTGGSGDTWKRYVDPLDPGFVGILSKPSDSYHGLIGARNAIVAETGEVLINSRRIHDFVGKHLWIPVAQPLRLGYEDDNYDDNGYWEHDDGSPDQCNSDNSHGFGGNAFVTVTIQHKQPRPATAPPLPWDIASADPDRAAPFDINGLLFNPRWGWQTVEASQKQSFNECTSKALAALQCGSGIFDSITCRQSAIAACVSQPTTEDTPNLVFNSMFGYCAGGLGHLNWTIVNYHGPLYWSEYSGRTPFHDDDYNFIMQTPITNNFPSGITKENGTHIPALGSDPITLEFEAQETIDHFGLTPFWKDFHTAVDSDKSFGTNFAHPMVAGKEAVAIGLLGLDIMEKATSEIHPVFVLAIHTNDDPADDTWAIFARNYGNEGMCSDNMHYADFNTVTLQLPRPASVPASSQATVTSKRFFSNARLSTPGTSSPLAIDIFPAQGVDPLPTSQDTFIAFHLPPTPNDGDDGARISGELHLQWSGVTAAAPALAARQSAEATSLAVAAASDTESEGPEARIDALLAQLTPEQLATAASVAGTDAAAADDQVEIVPTFLTKPPTQTNTPVVPTAVPSPRQRQVAERRGRALCAAFDGQPPADFGTCDSFSPFTQLAFTAKANAAGWFNTPVSLTLTAFNVNGKGIDHSEYSFDNVNWTRYAGPFTRSDGVFTLYFRSQDQAGKFETPQSRAFKVDTTTPVITGSRAPLANASGWNNTNVNVSFACSDALSGVAAGSPSGNTALSVEGAAQQAAGTCQDVAGNSAAAVVSGINIDKTPPVVAVTGITNGATYVLQAVPTAGCTTTDQLSGAATIATATVAGGTPNGVGTFTATCSGASDAAGNAAAPVTATFYVRYNFAGFFSPLTAGDGSYSGLFKMGRTIPVKWSLTDVNGTYLSALNTVKHLELAFNGDCVSDADGTPIDLGTSGGGGLRYDATGRQFIYNWDTSNAGQGCYSVLLYLDDNSPPHQTIVKLKP